MLASRQRIAGAHRLMQKRTRSHLLIFLLFACLGLTSGCTGLAYYHQAVAGQIALLTGSTPVEELLADAQTDEALRAQLVKAQAILAFASGHGLPVGDSYDGYVDLKRSFVVWNVFAAEPFGVSLLRHCFPIAGCVGYKGFFAEADAKEFAEQLRGSGYDVYVGGVAAYSTLGWFDDPLLNTFLYRDDARLAGVLFHELAHKVLYIEGDTVFNESFATAVERHLLRLWLESNRQEAVFTAYLASAARRADVITLILESRDALALVYESELSEPDKAQRKVQLIGELKASYRQRQKQWGSGTEFASWIEQDLNNAHLAAIGAYQSQVAGFSAMLRAAEDLESFYVEVEKLAAKPKPVRDATLLVKPTSG
ncbi:MAG: putative aminopeptidase [Candidatus Azotimanducaceae bacterium]